MTQCFVYDLYTKESETFFTLTAAKKWMRERQKQGHVVEGSKYKVYSNQQYTLHLKNRLIPLMSKRYQKCQHHLHY